MQAITIFAIVCLVSQAFADTAPLLIGGKPADILEFQHQVSVRIEGYHYCGGSIINSHWVLTAATCVYRVIPEIITILAGTTNRFGGPGSFLSDVETYAMHPSYQANVHAYDVAAIKTIHALQGLNMAPIWLAPEGLTISAGSPVVTAGWGKKEDNSLPQFLQKLELNSVNFNTCKLLWLNILGNEGQICAGQQGHDLCLSDNGGALVHQGVQIGIASFGNPNCDGSLPSVYADLANKDIRSFIRQITGV